MAFLILIMVIFDDMSWEKSLIFNHQECFL